ncbi:hypothetical protein U0070_005606 [Myodes glareolus]|uniref:Uncharacterized protein n=1 Tax=Myodes glareolus TaxID=447135 RepID=A0AAW0ILU4_MYOGA
MATLERQWLRFSLLLLWAQSPPHATGALLYFGFCSKDGSGAEKENASVLQQNSSLSGSRNGEESIIDNPYLRPVKKPKIRRKK